MIRNIKNLTIVEFFKLIKSPTKLFFVFAFPILFLILSGSMWGTNKIPNTQLHYIDFSFPGFIVWLTLSSAFQSLSSSLSYDRESKTLKQYSILNISKKQYITALFILYFINFIITFFLITIISALAFKMNLHNLYTNIFLLFLISIIVFILFFSLGVIIGSAFQTSEKTGHICLMIFFGLFFSSGAAIPAASISGNWFVWLQHISPAGNAVLILQRVFIGVNSLVSDKDYIFAWIYVILFTIIIIPLAIKFFKFR